MKERIKAVEVKIEPFWHLVETQLPKLLHQDTALRKDGLLDKMASGKLTYEEAAELDGILENELKGSTMPDRTVVYVLVLGRLKQIIRDFKNE